MKTTPKSIIVKLRQSRELLETIRNYCVKYQETKDEIILEEVASYFGTIACNLRAALNYAMWDFSENHLRPILPNKQYKDLTYFHDFPLTNDKPEFDRLTNSKGKILYFIHEYGFLEVYNFLEKSQPYHDENVDLRVLRWISNVTSHTISVESRAWNINDVVMSYQLYSRKPFFGDGKIIIPYPDDRPPDVYQTPCYIGGFDAFVNKDGEWMAFVVNAPEEDRWLGLIKYGNSLFDKVSQLIDDFYSLNSI